MKEVREGSDTRPYFTSEHFIITVLRENIKSIEWVEHTLINKSIANPLSYGG